MPKHFKCDICSKKFGDRYGLTSHMPFHSTETPFSCNQCSYRGKTKKYLARHMKQVHRETPRDHKCGTCGKLFLHQSSLKVHAMVHTGEKPHKCNVCGKSFRVTYSLNSHMLIHTNEKPFTCSFCDYACRDSSTLRKHQNKHMGLEKRYQCKICNKDYKSRAALKIHIGETHLDLDVRKFKCTQCDKRFKTNASRKLHIMSIHNRSLVCNCPICGRKLMNKNNLGAHMRTHLEERPFSCTHFGCNTSFKDKNSLTKHIVIHNPEMHFPCKYCGRKFARKEHRKQHERVMHVERKRSVECHHCGSRFYSKNYLLKHIQTKHVYKEMFKYICDTCGLITHNKPSIVMHLKYGHGNEHDLQCKICENNIVYKRHTYLKQHYWKTHNIRYKMTKKACSNKNKKENASVEVKVEPVEADSYEEIQLLEIQKHEEEELNDESLDYSKSVLSEDIAASVLKENARGSEVDFDEFFIRHVFAKQEDKTEEKNTDGIDKEKDEYVKRRIKQILVRTEKIQKAKAERKKQEEEEKRRIKKEKEDAIAKAKREIEELDELRRVRVMYNERMGNAVMKEKGAKDKVKIKYLKKVTVSSNKSTEDISDNLKENNDTVEENVVDKGVSIETNNKNELNDSVIKSNCTDETDVLQDNYRHVDNETENCIEVNNDKNVSNNDLEKFNVVECIDNTQRQENDNKECVDGNKRNETNADHEMNVNNKHNNDNEVETAEKEQNSEDASNMESFQENDEIHHSNDYDNTDNHEITVGDDHINDENVQNDQGTNKEIESIQENDEIHQSNDDANTDNHEINVGDDHINYENEQNDQSTNKEIESIQETDEIQKCIDVSHEITVDNHNNDENITKEVEFLLGNDEKQTIDETKDNESEDTSDDDTPLLKIRVKRKCAKKIDKNNEKVVDSGKAKKMEFKTYQCYVCFKLYQTKQELSSHCQEHFDICHSRTLTKCPICDHVSYKGLAKHMRLEHNTELTTLHNTIRGDNGDSGFSYDINGTNIQVIPSANVLNKTASDKIDKNRRDFKDKMISISKLVKKGDEWIVQKVSMPIQFDVIPELNDRELSKLKVTDNDVERLGQLSYLVKKRGLKMMFPCFKCDKICQNFAALKLHQRRHEDNPKPFKPRVKKGDKTDLKVKVKLDKRNRNALPKPIKNKHKCDEKLKEFFESNIRGGDIEFWQFLKIYNKMDREQVNDFTDLEKRSDFGNHLDYYKDVNDESDETND